jgi:hypothetical protein
MDKQPDAFRLHLAQPIGEIFLFTTATALASTFFVQNIFQTMRTLTSVAAGMATILSASDK